MVKRIGSMGPLCRETIEYLLNTERRTVSEIAAFFEVEYFHARRFIEQNKIPLLVAKSGRPIRVELKAEAERLLTETNLSIMEIQQRLGFKSRHTIYLIRERLEREQARAAVAEEAEAGLSFVDIAQRQELRRCPEHGKVSVWPCVICEAERYRAQSKANRLKIFSKTG